MTVLRVALQGKGRLNEDSLQILKDSGIYIEQNKRKLLSRSENFPLEVLYLRDDDIPAAVASSVADIGIVGENEVAEKGANVRVVEKLGFGRCRLSLAIPKREEYQGIGWFDGKRIATSYPAILRKYFEGQGVSARIEEISGSVEIAPAVDIADAIFDIVSSGTTLTSNGLVEVEKIMTSEAVLIADVNLSDEKLKILEQLLFRLRAVRSSYGKKYLMLNISNERIDDALAILPSMKSPSLLPLANSGWSSIHAVVEETQMWDMIERLKAIGAEDILVLSLEKMIR
ncbi:MAG: ATP phosphoribosyltransferase [Rikenellaceae bacterium]